MSTVMQSKAHSLDPARSRSQTAKLIGLTTLMMATTAISAETQYGPFQWLEADGGNGHLYELVITDGGLSWPEAAARAVAAGGHLATLTSQAETDFVLSVFDGAGSMSIVWSGLWQNRESVEFSEPLGGWEWVTGEPLTWTLWKSGEPNNAGPEHWGDITLGGSQPGRWNDSRVDSPPEDAAYLVEYVSSSVMSGGCCVVGECFVATIDECFLAGGAFAGLGTSCAELECPTACIGDVDGSGDIGLNDILLVIGNWGPCP